MHFSLVKIFPEGATSSHCFDDIILPLYYALTRLGYEAETRVNSPNPHSINILFGTSMVPGLADDAFPANSVIFNLEQLTSASCQWNNKRYIDHLRRFTVWDYSHRNVRYLKKSLGLNDTVEVRLGYVPEMTRLNPSFPHDIDVLFYGSMNERRRAIINTLTAAKLRVGVLNGGYGTERDHAIARTKLLLNVHYYTPATLEVPRLGYIWANHKAAVSERAPETEMFGGLEDACAYAVYDELVPRVLALVADKAAREKQAGAGFAAFSALRQEDILEAVVGRRIRELPGMPRPARLHAGSGKDFRTECLNVDINPATNPDLVLDLSQSLDPSAGHMTRRFGEVFFTPGSFTHITAFDLLEHVRELPQIMHNFLDLLCEGGELQITVPYELSEGAWQDPTHVRTFNENSWRYYTDWAWYLGWRDERFSTTSLAYILTKYGKSLSDQGLDMEEILRSPRAVESMAVTLRKCKATPAEQHEYDAKARTFYQDAVGEWVVS